MNLFDFKFKPIEQIEPWGDAPNLSLSWFALTDGVFRVNVGKNVLFRYSKEIIQHWQLSHQDADYHIASFAADFLGSTAAALTPLPNFLQPLAWNWELLRDVVIKSSEHENYYDAFRWLGERSPWTSYLNANPEISFILKENNIIISWDNRACVIDNLPVWEAQFGTYTLSVDEYFAECIAFANRLLDEMSVRIQMLASGQLQTKIPVDTDDLLKQHETWQKEFNQYLTAKPDADIDWAETKIALDTILDELKIKI